MLPPSYPPSPPPIPACVPAPFILSGTFFFFGYGTQQDRYVALKREGKAGGAWGTRGGRGVLMMTYAIVIDHNVLVSLQRRYREKELGIGTYRNPPTRTCSLPTHFLVRSWHQQQQHGGNSNSSSSASKPGPAVAR